MVSSFSSRLAKLESPSVPQNDKISGYQNAISHLENPVEDIPAVIKSILVEGNLGIVATRPLLSAAVQTISAQDTDTQISICTQALALLEGKTTYEEQDIQIRQLLATSYQQNEDFSLAAQTLEQIPLDSTTRKLSDYDKVDHWITICRLYIEEDDMLAAETFLNKAKTLRYKITDAELILKFELSRARILDSKREFLDASTAYYAVSQSSALAEEDRNASLTVAITTSILSAAGPQRSKQLSRLYKDERSSQLPEYPILSKMHLNALISPAEIEAFSNKLSPHQLAKTSDGSTVLAKAMIEHNLLAASKLYSNLDFDTLAQLLGLCRDVAEGYAARMLEQKRVSGRIDQIEGWVEFLEGNEGGVRGWDKRVGGLVEDIERVASLVVEA